MKGIAKKLNFRERIAEGKIRKMERFKDKELIARSTIGRLKRNKVHPLLIIWSLERIRRGKEQFALDVLANSSILSKKDRLWIYDYIIKSEAFSRSTKELALEKKSAELEKRINKLSRISKVLSKLAIGGFSVWGLSGIYMFMDYMVKKGFSMGFGLISGGLLIGAFGAGVVSSIVEKKKKIVEKEKSKVDGNIISEKVIRKH